MIMRALLCVATILAVARGELELELPTLTLEELRTHVGAALALQALTGLGALALTAIPGYPEARRAALAPLPACLAAARANGAAVCRTRTACTRTVYGVHVK